MRNHLGDIVTMPLPTQWAPSPARAGAPGGVAPGVPGGYMAIPGLTPPPNAPAAYRETPGLIPGPGPNGLQIPGTVIEPGGGSDDPSLWAPNLVLPDSMLPPALRRNQHGRGRIVFSPNKYDYLLMRKARMWEWIADHGGLRTCCYVPELGRPLWSQPPWQVMPSNGLEYREPVSAALASISGGPPFDGTDTVIGSWRVPLGYDGVLNRFVCGFTGDGFSDFSGSIVWRVQIDNRYGRNLGNVVNTYGGFQNAFLIPGYGIRLVSGQTVSVIVSIPAGSPVTAGADGAGVVTAGTFGWVYPRR